MGHSVCINGIFQSAPLAALDECSLEEMIFATVRGALDDAQLDIAEIDSVVAAANDQYDGRVISSMVTSGAFGAVGRDNLTLASAGEHALIAAYLRLRSGSFRHSLAVTWCKPSESLYPDDVDRLAADPFFMRPIGMNGAVAAGLQAEAYRAASQVPREAALGVVVKNRANGVMNPRAFRRTGVSAADVERSALVAWPLHELELPQRCDAAVAVVMSRSDTAPSGVPAAWIHGVGWSIDRYELGDRNVAALDALAGACRNAYRQAGIRSPRREIDVIELQEGSSYGELLAYEALALCDAKFGWRLFLDGATGPEGDIPVNLSGGGLSTDPTFASGFIRVTEAALQIQGRAGVFQRPKVDTALATASYGFAGQGASAFVLRTDAPRS
jgi:acetyl-CoA C-acetyltransferase